MGCSLLQIFYNLNFSIHPLKHSSTLLLILHFPTTASLSSLTITNEWSASSLKLYPWPVSTCSSRFCRQQFAHLYLYTADIRKITLDNVTVCWGLLLDGALTNCAPLLVSSCVNRFFIINMGKMVHFFNYQDDLGYYDDDCELGMILILHLILNQITFFCK